MTWINFNNVKTPIISVIYIVLSNFSKVDLVWIISGAALVPSAEHIWSSGLGAKAIGRDKVSFSQEFCLLTEDSRDTPP